MLASQLLPRIRPSSALKAAGCFIAAAGVAAGVAMSGAASPTAGAECRAVKLIAVRGSGDTLNTIGIIGVKISGALARRANDVGLDYGAYGLPYTAVGIDWWKLSPTGSGILFLQYQRSKDEGRNKLRAFVKQQVRDCPTQKLALVGFSQGAHVVADVLSKNVGGLTPTEFSAIRAVALIADPRFNSREPFATGYNLQPGRNGLLGARSPRDLSGVSGRVRSWCSRRDLVCQGLPNPLFGIHNQNRYFTEYGTGIVNFIAEKLDWNSTPPIITGITGTTQPSFPPWGPLTISYSDPQCDVVGGRWEGVLGSTDPRHSQDFLAIGSCSRGQGSTIYYRTCWLYNTQTPGAVGTWTEYIRLQDARGNQSPWFSYSYRCGS